MPKRPSAVTLTQDQQTILCADKFGDVYAMPLLWQPPSSPDEISNAPDPTEGYTSFKAPSKTAKPSAPAASSATVHTKTNLRALAEQQRLATRPDLNSPKKTPNKDALNFPHKLLLGHVSLLTDLVAVTLTSPSNFPGQRSYILTSDRDEHIRVSRGMPQAHIIENFCLGHGHFVNKIHVPPWRPEVLISGGGDEFLIVWDWIKGETTQQVDLLTHVETVRKKFLGESGGMATDGVEGSEDYKEHPEGQKEDPEVHDGPEKQEKTSKVQKGDSEAQKGSTVAVSGIWSIGIGIEGAQTGEVIVTCEAVPALLVFKLGIDGALSFRSALPAEGNVLDVSICSEERSLFYTVDNVHVPATTKEVLDLGEEERRVFVGAWRFDKEKEDWVKEGGLVNALNIFANAEEDSLTADMDTDAVSDLLYGIERLRKTR